MDRRPSLALRAGGKAGATPGEGPRRHPEPLRCVMRCHEDRQDPLRDVMKCHDRHAHGVYPAAVLGMKTAAPASLTRLRGGPVLSAGNVSPGCTAALPSPRLSPQAGPGDFRALRRGPGFTILHVVPSSRFVPLRSVLPAARLPERRDPDSRVSCAGARARRRAYRGGAVRAPDCPHPPARERIRAQGTRLPSASRVFFRAGADAEDEAASGYRLFLTLYSWKFSIVKLIWRNISNFSNETPSSIVPSPESGSPGNRGSATRRQCGHAGLASILFTTQTDSRNH